MSPRRSMGPVIAYMLTLLGLVLGGIWLWRALRHNQMPPPRHAPEARLTAPQPASAPPQPASAAPPQATAPPSREELSATERQQLDAILRRKSTGRTH